MTDPAADAARSAAAILAPDLGPGLPAEVEAALAARGTQQRPDRYLDPVSLAGLIVAIATLAWTIYNDRRKQDPGPPPADAIARQVRITLRDQRHGPAPRHRADHRGRRHRDHPPGQPTRVARPTAPVSATACRGGTDPRRIARRDPLGTVSALHCLGAAAVQATTRRLWVCRCFKTVLIGLWPSR